MKVVARGVWLYDSSVPTPVEVEVVRLDYDFWYSLGEADGTLGPDEKPCLNEDGHLFYLRLRPTAGADFWPDSAGFSSLEEAKLSAEARVPEGRSSAGSRGSNSRDVESG